MPAQYRHHIVTEHTQLLFKDLLDYQLHP